MTEPTDDDPTQLLLLRLRKAQDNIKDLTMRDPIHISDTKWLRDMAALRRELAAIYTSASDQHAHDSIEWHALREAAFMHEINATEDELAACQHEAEDATK